MAPPSPWRAGLSHLTPSERQVAPSPLVGEGWGGGCLFVSAEPRPPSRLGREAREPISPTRGEVTGASREPYAIALPLQGRVRAQDAPGSFPTPPGGSPWAGRRARCCRRAAVPAAPA